MLIPKRLHPLQLLFPVVNLRGSRPCTPSRSAAAAAAGAARLRRRCREAVKPAPWGAAAGGAPPAWQSLHPAQQQQGNRLVALAIADWKQTLARYSAPGELLDAWQGRCPALHRQGPAQQPLCRGGRALSAEGPQQGQGLPAPAPPQEL